MEPPHSNSTGTLPIIVKPISLSNRQRFSHVDEGLCGVVGELHDTEDWLWALINILHSNYRCTKSNFVVEFPSYCDFFESQLTRG